MQDSILNFDDINDYFDFLCEHKLTPEQFAFVYTLLLDERDSKGRIKHNKHVTANIYKFVDNVRTWNQKEIEDLEKRGLIRNYNKKQGSSQKRTVPEYYEVTQSFKDLLVQSPGRVGEELWRRYPDWLFIDGKRVNAKTADKDEIISKYHRIIHGSYKQHVKVMRALEYQKNHDMINMGIEKYVGSRAWERVQKEIGEDDGDTFIEEESEIL